MRVVLDTNVLVSGVFWSGPPHRVLQAWREGRFRLVLSGEIQEEYQRVIRRFSQVFPAVDLAWLGELLAVYTEFLAVPDIPVSVSRDAMDDKFLVCALLADAVLVTGDADLLSLRPLAGLEILTPREFVRAYLTG